MNINNINMKYIVFFTYSLFIFQILGQSGYKWINHPTISGILNEFEDNERDYRLLNGKVKEIEVLFYNSSSTDPASKITAKYTESGNILSFLQISKDPESSKTVYFLEIEFIYDNNNKIIRELIKERYEGKKIKHSKNSQKMFFSNYPNPITIDHYGNSLSITLEEDTTYSFYDDIGRKIMDSIPFGSSNEGKKDKYTYFTDSIYCEKIWSAWSDVPSEREIYILDFYGNWVEKKIFWDNDLKWSDRIIRNIVYY
jgi:hypothetical protein